MLQKSYIDWIREQVGTRKIFLTFASVILWDGNGRILLQHRGDFNIWGLPGGALERGEDILTCAHRELGEETGLTAAELTLVGIYDDPRYDVVYPNGDQVQQFTVCFQGQKSGGRLQIDGLETVDLRFVTPAEAANLPMRAWYRDMIRDALGGELPTFAPPYHAAQFVDQITGIRPLIGHVLYIGVGATMLAINDEGHLLMLQHVGEEGWRFPAGFAHLGENLAQTAVREMWEETGLHVLPKRIVAVYSTINHTYPNGDQVQNAGVLFQVQVQSGAISLDMEEVIDVAWIAPDDILKKVSAHHTYFKKILAHLDQGYVII